MVRMHDSKGLDGRSCITKMTGGVIRFTRIRVTMADVSRSCMKEERCTSCCLAGYMFLTTSWKRPTFSSIPLNHCAYLQEDVITLFSLPAD